MDALKKTIQRIEDGFVVNEHGRWLYMAEQRIYEKRVIEQIVNGNVLVDGKWVAVGEAGRLALRGKTAARKQPAPAQNPPPPPEADFEAMSDMMETICMDMASVMKPQEPKEEPAANADGGAEETPGRVDPAPVSGLPAANAAERSRRALAYIDGLNLTRKHKDKSFKDL